MAPDVDVALHRIRVLDPEVRGRILGAAATLGVDPERLLTTDRPSPGEARKVVLARLLTGDAGVLLLDEPTNHLDLSTIERLEDALNAVARGAAADHPRRSSRRSRHHDAMEGGRRPRGGQGWSTTLMQPSSFCWKIS